jgi:hypothetical protein
MIDKGNIKFPPVEQAWRIFRRDRLDAHMEIAAGRLPGVDPLMAMLYVWGPDSSRAEAWRELLTPNSNSKGWSSGFTGRQFDGLLFACARSIEAVSMVIYADDKKIYRPDSLLIESLMDVDVRPETPMSLFAPLRGTIGLELPRRTAVGIFNTREFLVTVFDEKDKEEGPRSMAILANCGPDLGFKPIAVLDLRGNFKLGPTMSFSSTTMFEGMPVDHVNQQALVQSQVAEYSSATGRLIYLILNLLLYILGSEDITTIVRAQRKNLCKKSPVEACRIRDLQDPHVFGVGAKWGRAVQNWVAEPGVHGASAPGSGRSISPHIRAAHPHLYWTGPGKTVPVIKFLLPVPVKGGATPGDGESLPVIHAMH